MKNGTQGFTLIELLIVIAIIGILAAVLIPNLLGARKRAYDTSAMSCAKSIQTTQATFQIDQKRYALFTKAAAATQVTITDPALPTGTTALAAADLNAYRDDLNQACNNPDIVIAAATAPAGEVVAADIPTTNPNTTAYAIQVIDRRGSQAYVVTANKMGNRASTATERGAAAATGS